MSVFAELGGKLKSLYGRWSLYVDMAARFVLAFVCFFWICRSGRATGIFAGIPVLLAAAALVTVLSSNMIAYLGSAFLLAAAWSRGPDIAAASAAVILVLWMLFLRFAPEDAKDMVLLPFLAFFGFMPLVPLYCGLRRKPTAAFALAPGVVFYMLLYAVGEAESLLPALDGVNIMTRLNLFLHSAFGMETVVQVIAVVSCMLLVYIVRRTALDYAFYIAPAAGGLLYLLCLFLGNAVAGTEFALVPQVIGTAASVFVMILYLMLFLPLDFAKSRNLRFEDDDYYYYVKAVPKFSSYEEGEDEEEEDDEE